MKRILDAREVHGVRTLNEYVHRHAELMEMAGRQVWRATTSLLAMYIEHGRYIAECPFCCKPLSGSREWQLALCFTCGAVFALQYILWPDETIERELCKRPVDAQTGLPIHANWKLFETLDTLQRENFEHGVT